MDYGVEDLKQNMLSLYENRESADLTLVCASQTFKIHSFMFCPRSSFFRAAFEGGFKEEIAKEIELPEDDAYLISKLIYYCYTADYNLDGDGDKSIDIGAKRVFYFPLYIHVGMYSLAGKYDLKNLKKLAENKFRTRLEYFQPSSPKESPVDPTLTPVLEVIPFIYNTTLDNDRGLRDLVLGYVIRHWSAFLALQQFSTFIAANSEFIHEVLKENERQYIRRDAINAWSEETRSLESDHTDTEW